MFIYTLKSIQFTAITIMCCIFSIFYTMCDWKFYISVMCFTEIDMAVTAFAELQELDPYRLENMDTYSNLLYIKVSACRLKVVI